MTYDVTLLDLRIQQRRINIASLETGVESTGRGTRNEVTGSTLDTERSILSSERRDLDTHDLLATRAGGRYRTSIAKLANQESGQTSLYERRAPNLGIDHNIRDTQIALDIAVVAVAAIRNGLQMLLVLAAAATKDSLGHTTSKERRNRLGRTPTVVLSHITGRDSRVQYRNWRHTRATRGHSDTHEISLAIDDGQTGVIGGDVDIHDQELRKNPATVIGVGRVADHTLGDHVRAGQCAGEVAIEAQVSQRVNRLTALQLVRAAPDEVRVALLDHRLSTIVLLTPVHDTEEGQTTSTINSENAGLVSERMLAVVDVVDSHQHTGNSGHRVGNVAGRSRDILGHVRIAIGSAQLSGWDQHETRGAGHNAILEQSSIAASGEIGQSAGIGNSRGESSGQTVLTLDSHDSRAELAGQDLRWTAVLAHSRAREGLARPGLLLADVLRG